MIEPDYQRWDCAVFSYPSIDAFLSTRRIENGIHAISVNEYLVDFLFQKKASENLMVVFGGAATRSDENNPPFFSGIGLAKYVNCSFMAINDPSLYLDCQITLAWYAGSKSLPLQSILPAVIDKVASACASHTIMTGGSAGGFASLYYATKTSQPSIAVVYNPQTNIINYLPRSVERFAKVCFGWHEGNVESAFRDITYDLAKYYLEEKAPTIYLQNSADYRHITTHAIPFLKAYGLDWTGTDLTARDLYLHVGYWGSGHKPPPKELITYIINQLGGAQYSTNAVGGLLQPFSRRRPCAVGLAQNLLRYCAPVVGFAQRFSRRHRWLVNLARVAFRVISARRVTAKMES